MFRLNIFGHPSFLHELCQRQAYQYDGIATLPAGLPKDPSLVPQDTPMASQLSRLERCRHRSRVIFNNVSPPNNTFFSFGTTLLNDPTAPYRSFTPAAGSHHPICCQLIGSAHQQRRQRKSSQQLHPLKLLAYGTMGQHLRTAQCCDAD